ncbi:MAG: hypothetical protein J5694_04435 [Erysipelotrichaceae bacterium]|nr:hypothetical protein [Erysipelotrichaceae bacterium]
MFRRFLLILTVMAMVMTSSVLNISAEEQTQQLMVLNAGIAMKLQPSEESEPLTIDGAIQYFVKDGIYDITQTVEAGEQEKWYGVNFTDGSDSHEVFINAVNVELLDMEFENRMKQEGFPNDYVVLLRQLHKLHPNWNFVAFHNNIKWYTMVEKESVLRKNLISGSNVNLRSTQEGAYDPVTGQFIPLDGTSWYQANSETIAYYMDPRNFLNETNVFMFLHLAFNSSEGESLVQQVLNNTFMAGKDPIDKLNYSQIFYDAGENAAVSPIYLATLAKQESGVNGNKATSGEAFTYNGKTYSGLYNFFNIGASSGTDNWKKGLIFANGGEDGSLTAYERPWKSPVKAIRGGALWIAKGYINRGQDTMYLQKFNCTSYSTYSHQYMTNVQAAYSQSRIMYNTYKNNSALDLQLNFRIPVYLDMPEATALPTSITYPPSPNDPDPSEVYTGDMIVDLDLANNDGYLSGFQLGMTYQEFKAKITLVNSEAEVRIEASGSEITDSTPLSSGQVLTYTTKEGTSTYTIVIRGDLDGDGRISTKDYLIFRKVLLGLTEIKGAFLKAALFDGESKPSTKGYIIMRKHLLDISQIKQ